MRFQLLSLVAIATLTNPAAAQRESRFLPDGPAIGFSAGAVVADGSAILIGTLHSYGLRAGRVGPAMAFSFVPQALLSGVLLAAGDFGAAYNASMPETTLLLKAGGTGLLGIGSGAAGLPGVHLGAALIRGGGSTGLVFDVTHRWVWTHGSAQGFWTLGFGITSLPRIGR